MKSLREREGREVGVFSLVSYIHIYLGVVVRGRPKREGIYVNIYDSLCCIAETNKIVNQVFPNKKLFRKGRG